MTTNSLSRPWRIECQNDAEAVIYLYQDLGSSGFPDSPGITAQAFADDLRKLGPVQRILLRVNSGGGSVFDGIGVYNSLLTHGARIVAQIDGVAASISSVVVMSAQRIVMAPESFLMIHNPSSSILGGEANDFRAMATALDKVKSTIVSAYKRHSKLSSGELSKLMDAESWFSPAEAIDAGLAHEILDTGQRAPIAASLNLSKFKRVPREIAARMQRSAPPSPSVSDSMSMEELAAAHERLLLQKRVQDLRWRNV